MPLSRESRVLIITIVVCVVVLLVLARLRFPEQAIVPTTTQPLERLAARASYDALADDIQRVEATIAPNLVALRTTSRADTNPRRMADVLTPSGLSSGPRHVPALRIDSGTAVAALDPDVNIEGILGPGQSNGAAAVLGTNPVRRLSRVRVPEAPARQLPILPLTSLAAPVYVVAVEGTQAGVTLRPVFLGRADRFSHARWSRPLLPLGGIGLSEGALLFTLSGEFLGVVVVEDGAHALASARDVLDTADALGSSPWPTHATLGISVQPLTPVIAAAAGADRGVVVSEVDAEGPASGALLPADVVTALDGEQVTSPERFLLDIASRQPGRSVVLNVVRRREAREIKLPLTAEAGAPGPAEAVMFERVPGVGTRVTAGRSNGYELPGLLPGDIVVGTAEIADPTPSQLRRLIESTPPSTAILFIVRRDGTQRVIGVRTPPSADAARE